ncbi:MAG: phosphatidylglycerophosphatase A [Verrucomicrobia bacterium]|nr:phosphatidylglycerophosphatase A [Verrucomicrobiota bacterium]
MGKGFNQGFNELLKATRDVADELGDKEQRVTGVVYEAITPDSRTADFTFRTQTENDSSVILFIAQGFGVGRIPFAPGTFGSLVGLLWFLALLSTGNVLLFLTGSIAGVAVSVWLCDKAESILRQRDPRSVVLDEIVAVPFCFASWVAVLFFKNGHLPAPEYFFSSDTWLLTAGVFAAFRFFDVLKPWPVRQSQSLPGGWGVTMDDLLAAANVNVTVLLVYCAKMSFAL